MRKSGERGVNLHRRIQALENAITTGPVTLIMQDGRIETLRGPGDLALDLLARACRGDRSPEMELIAQSVSSTEPGGGHLLGLAHAILNSPVDQTE